MFGPQKPFLKWAGNKYQIIDHVRAAVRAVHTAAEGRLDRYVEPFLGSGAAFLSLPVSFSEYALSDFNGDITNLFEEIRSRGEVFIQECASEFTPEANTQDGYYLRRDEFNSISYGPRRAALFVYMNRHGFNGLCRYNSSGAFNVPAGRYKSPYFPEAELRAFAALCSKRNVTFSQGSFDDVLRGASLGEGDLVYCDPPYAPLDQSSNFTGYASKGFGLDTQLELAQMADAAAQRGAWVILSNHDTSLTRALYDATGASEEARGAHQEILQGWRPRNGRILGSFGVQRFISANGSRNKAPELFAVFGPTDRQVDLAVALFRAWQDAQD